MTFLCASFGGLLLVGRHDGSAFELQSWHHASRRPIGMNVHQRLLHLAAAVALTMRQSGPPDISPVFLRFSGMRWSSLRFRRCEPPRSGVALASVTARVVLALPPNQCLEPTAQQRRCACCWVPSSLRSSASAQARRWAARWLDVLNFSVGTMPPRSRSA